MPSTGPRSGHMQRVAGIELLTLRGESTRLAELTTGQVAVISLWTTWCAACETELPALERLYERVQGRAAVIAVAVGEPHEKVARFVEHRGLRYAQLCDERFRLADALGQPRVPATLIVG